MKTKHRVLCLLLAAICLFSAFPSLAASDGAQAETSAPEADNTQAADTQADGLANDPSSLPEWPQGPELFAEAGLLMDARTGTVLFSQNGDERLYPASITKLMTALLVFENCSLSDVVTFSHEAVYSIEADSSHISVSEGEQLTVEQCLYALFLKSANEVANGLAEHVAGSMSAFAEMMNNRAAQLGCTDTHFVNANGLHDDNHYTTCRDMALIMQALIHNDTFIQISSADKYSIPPTNKMADTRYLVQTHKMLCPSEYTYEGTVTGKTGFTPEAGNTLVTYAVRGDLELIAVSMNSNWKHYDDTIAMFDYGFENFTACSMAAESEVPANSEDFLSSSQGIFDTSSATLALSDDSWAVLPNGLTAASLESSLTLLPNTDSNIIANIVYSYHGIKLGNGSLELINKEQKHFDFAAHETAEQPHPVKDKPDSHGTFFINLWLVGGILLAVIILVLIVCLIVKHRRRNRSVIRIRSAKRDLRRRRRKNRRYLSNRESTIDRR